MSVRSMARTAAIFIVLMLIIPPFSTPPASAGTVLSQSVADFSKGTNNNTTVWPEGLVLKSVGTDPYNWTNIGNYSPCTQWAPVIDYDVASGVFIMVGRNYNGYNEYQLTWTYDLSTDTWTRIADNNRPRQTGSGAFDNAKGEMIVQSFNGTETWAMNIATGNWTSKNPALTPIPREGYSMAFDPALGEMVLFGGGKNPGSGNCIYYNDTWSYNLSQNTWTNRTSAGSPPARAYCSMIYDSVNKVMVLFGGNTGLWLDVQNQALFGDTWIYDPGTYTWTNMSPAVSPPPRDKFSMAYHKAGGETVLYGGFLDNQSVMGNDTWSYNLSRNAWANLTPKNSPPPRCGHSMAYDPVNNRIVLVGGASPAIYNWRADSWSYNLTANDWTMGTLKAPSSRQCPQAAYDSDTGEIVLFGGYDMAYQYLQSGSVYLSCGDTWKFNLSQNLWTLLSPTKSCQQIQPLYGYGWLPNVMAYDRRCKEMVLFNPEDDPIAEIYSFNLSTNTWKNKNPENPPSRTDMANTITYHEKSGVMVLYQSTIYGGLIYTYNLSSNIWTHVNSFSLPSYDYASSVYLESDDEILFFGRIAAGKAETWKYDLGTDQWTKLLSAGNPPVRIDFSMAYDRFRDEVVLNGGYSSGYLSDTWCFNVATNTWSEIRPTSKPPTVYRHVLVCHEIENEVLMVGGVIPNIWTFNRNRFYEAGSYTSPKNDTGGIAYFGNITWGASVPDNTSMRVQVRSGVNESTLDSTNFTGPDGTSATFYNVSGQQINGIHNGSRWIQYRVFMNTSFEKRSPVLTSIQIRYNLLHNVTISSPKGGEIWTAQKLIKWNATYPDKDNLTFDIYLLNAAGGSVQLAANQSNQNRTLNWDTTTARSGNYRIKVVAKDDNRTIPLEANDTSDVFTLAHPNRAPVVELLRPSYAETVNSGSVTLEWNGNDDDGDALKYYVFLAFVEFFIECLPDVAAVTSETNITISNLTDNAMYYWSVIADDGIENSTLPEVYTFTVHIPPPPPKNHPPQVTLVAPAEGETVTNMSTQLIWNGYDADKDRLTYFLFFAEADFNLFDLPPVLAQTNETSFNLSNLTDGSTYYWAVIANDGKENGTGITVRKFTVHVVIPADTPRIIEYSPKGKRAPLNPAIVVSFDREMDMQSVFLAISISPQVDITNFMRSANNFTFNLGSPLTPETTYNVLVGTTAKSSKGKNLFLPFKWNFTTLAPGEIDSELPVVLLSDPANGATNVDRWKNITIMFSEAMALTSTKAACSITPSVNGTWEWMNQRGFAIQFRHGSALSNGTYKVTISSGAIDESGNPLADNVTFSFSVGVPMTGKPKLVIKSLEGKGIRLDAVLVLAFDRKMNPDSVREAFRISPAVEGTWTSDAEGKIFTFTPAKKFRAGTTYTITMSTTVADVEGNRLEQPASWSFTTVQAVSPVGIGTTEWLLLALVVIAVAGIAAFAVTRRKKAAGPSWPGAAGLSAPKGFAIEEIFLMYNDGRLIQHTTRRMKADMDVDVFASMLTAMQAFVKDSFGKESRGELGSMEFGGSKVLFEKGKRVIVAVVITGGEPAGFRDEMKAAVKNVESEYGAVLQGWDGDASSLAGAKRFLAELGAYKVVEEAITGKPKADVSVKGELEFYQGFVRVKVAVKNSMPTTITNAALDFMYDQDMLRLDHLEPVLPTEGSKVHFGNVEPNEKKTVAFYLDPQICTESYVEGMLTFKDAHGNLESMKMPRKLTSVVCPILFTEENINTAMLKRMASDELDKKDSKVFTIPSNMTTQKAFEVGKAAIQHHDVKLVRELKEDKPFRAEAWYYGKAKGRPDKLVVQVRIIPEMSFLEFSVSSDSVLMLTGMLAELKSDLNKELETHKLKGAMKQVTDRDDMDAVAEIRLLLEKATEIEKETGKEEL